MSSSRDFNVPFAPYRRNRSRSRDRFSRPGYSRIPSGDYARDRDRDRDRDRHHEREPRDRDRRNDRDRDRDRDLDLDTARTTHTPQDQPAKMDPDRASAELAKALHQVTDLMTQKTQLSLKREAELKAYHKRKQDYECQISKPVQFPAVHEAFQGIQNHHKQTLAGIDKELAVLASKETVAFDKCAQTIVRALPFDEIKIRQILEACKGELGLVPTSSQPAQEERLKKLEQRQADFEETWKKQIASLNETQQNQNSELAEYRKRDLLRADSAKENEQLRAEVTSLRSEVISLAQRVGTVESAESFGAYVDKQIGLLKVELSKTVEEVRLDSIKAMEDKPSPVQDESLLQEMAVLRQKCGELSREIEHLKETSTSHTERIAALDTGVKKHEALLANTDVENLKETSTSHTERIAALDMGVKKHEALLANIDVENLKETSTSHTERIAALDTGLKNLDTGVKNHEALLANIDVENLDETITDCVALKTQVAAQNMVIEDVKRSVAETLARVPEKMPADLPASFRAWSDRFMQVFGTKLDEHTKQIKSLQDFKSATGAVAVAQASRAATASTPRISTSLAPESEAVAPSGTSAESRLTEVESKTVAIDSKVTAVQETVAEVQKIAADSRDIINTLGSQADRRYGALETMVESLSSQWSNMSTAHMAHAILEQLSRLQPAQLVPEIRHFQERLSEVEKLVQEDGEQRKNLSMGMQSVCEDIAKAPKRGLGPEDKFPGHHDKRARIEGQNGMNGMNGYANGYVHP